MSLLCLTYPVCLPAHLFLSLPCLSCPAPSIHALEKTRVQLQTETNEFRAKALEEQKKRENQDALVRRLQKRVLLLTKVRSVSDLNRVHVTFRKRTRYRSNTHERRRFSAMKPQRTSGESGTVDRRVYV